MRACVKGGPFGKRRSRRRRFYRLVKMNWVARVANCIWLAFRVRDENILRIAESYIYVYMRYL